MRKIDFQNDSNLTGDYPLFFGKPLGLFDSLNQPYPELDRLNDEQQALFWPSKEVSLAKDAVDIAEAEPEVINLLIENLSFQMAADSFASGTISGLFLPILSNSSAVELIEYHSMSESIHAKAYFRIIAEAFNDPNRLFERIKANERIFERLETIMVVFREHNKMLKGYLYEDLYQQDPSYCRRTVIKTVAALLALEGIMFLTSFANTFALTEATQRFNGVSKLVGLIRDDEAISHKNNMIAFLDIIVNKEKWAEWDDVKGEVKDLLDTIVNQELDWVVHLFKACKPLIGFNGELLNDYTYHLAKPIYDRFNIQWDFPVVNRLPFPWINKYVKADLVQVAPQESEVTNYLTGLANDDTSDTEFEFEV